MSHHPWGKTSLVTPKCSMTLGKKSYFYFLIFMLPNACIVPKFDDSTIGLLSISMNKAPQKNSAIYWKPIKRSYQSKLNKKACLTQKKIKI